MFVNNGGDVLLGFGRGIGYGYLYKEKFVKSNGKKWWFVIIIIVVIFVIVGIVVGVFFGVVFNKKGGGDKVSLGGLVEDDFVNNGDFNINLVEI